MQINKNLHALNGIEKETLAEMILSYGKGGALDKAIQTAKTFYFLELVSELVRKENPTLNDEELVERVKLCIREANRVINLLETLETKEDDRKEIIVNQNTGIT